MEELQKELRGPSKSRSKSKKIDIVHYESPPRRALREKEEEKLNEIEGRLPIKIVREYCYRRRQGGETGRQEGHCGASFEYKEGER